MKNKLSWNSRKTIFVNSSLNKVYKEGTGNCAEVNLNLVLMLRLLGFDVYPVILSTKENGFIKKFRPTVIGFNYVIALVKLNGVNYLLDANEKYSEINLIPNYCLNGSGRIVNRNGGEWLNLLSDNDFSIKTNQEITVQNDLTMNGKSAEKYNDYAVYSHKKEFSKFNNYDEFVKSLEKKNTNFEIQNFTNNEIDTLNKNLKISYDFSLKNYGNSTDSLFYFSPVLNPYFEKNPFKLDKRDYPIEFDYPINIQQSYSFTIPENFVISEIPKPTIIKLPENAGKFMMQIQNSGNKIVANTIFTIDKIVFQPDEYEDLKDFFQILIDKQKELVVLKKK